MEETFDGVGSHLNSCPDFCESRRGFKEEDFVLSLTQGYGEGEAGDAGADYDDLHGDVGGQEGDVPQSNGIRVTNGKKDDELKPQILGDELR